MTEDEFRKQDNTQPENTEAKPKVKDVINEVESREQPQGQAIKEETPQNQTEQQEVDAEVIDLYSKLMGTITEFATANPKVSRAEVVGTLEFVKQAIMIPNGK